MRKLERDRRRRVERKLLTGVIIAGPTIVAVQTAPQSEASASGTCSGFGNYHIGWGSNYYSGSQPTTVEGVSAQITDRNGYILCSGDTNPATNFSTVWDLVAGHGLGAYVQSGTMYRYGDSCVTEWAEQKQGANYPFYDYYVPNACSANKNVHRYWQQAYYTGTDYVFRSNVDTTIIAQTSWNPFAYLETPFIIQLMGETTYRQSDTPGTASLPEDYASQQVQFYSDDSWHGICGYQSLGEDIFENPNFATAQVACDHTQTWTISQ